MNILTQGSRRLGKGPNSGQGRPFPSNPLIFVELSILLACRSDLSLCGSQCGSGSVSDVPWNSYQRGRGGCEKRALQVKSAGGEKAWWAVLGDSKWPGVAGAWGWCVLGKETTVGDTV